jgi:hypothetical protein
MTRYVMPGWRHIACSRHAGPADIEEVHQKNLI